MFSSSWANVIDVTGCGGAAAVVVVAVVKDAMVVVAVVLPRAIMPDGAVVDAADDAATEVVGLPKLSPGFAAVDVKPKPVCNDDVVAVVPKLSAGAVVVAVVPKLRPVAG